MSNQTLIDIRNKVARANHHFDDFKAEFGLGPRATKPSIYPSRIHFEPNWTHIELKTDFPEIQREIGLVLGDAIHQMRSSLDHVVSYLVLQETKSRDAMRKAQFPIFHDATEFFDFKKHKSVKFLADTFGNPSDVFTEIQEAQPYKRNPSAPKEDALWVLSSLDNIDKHRTILVLYNRITITGLAESEDGRYQSRFRFPKQPVKAGTQVLNFQWPHPVPPATVNMEDISPWIVLDETDGLCDDLSIFPLFTRIREAVNQTITKFERFFS